MRKTKKHVLPQDIEIEYRRQRALELKLLGYKYVDIGKKLDVSLHTAWQDVQAAFAELRKKTCESAELVRHQQELRLDNMLVNLLPKIEAGDVAAVNAALKIEERRSKLLGLDVVSKVEVSGPNGGAIEVSDARGQLAIALARLGANSDTGTDQ